MEKKGVKSLQPSDCKFMETASRSTTTQNETDEDLQDGRMNG